MKWILFLSLLFASCSNISPLKATKPFPPKTTFQSLNAKKPILGTTPEGNYVVTEEFITRATQEHEYIKEIDAWKDSLIIKP